MLIEIARLFPPLLTDYAAISIAFEVKAIMEVEGDGEQWTLTPQSLTTSYVKDYDAIAGSPVLWPSRFDTSNWALFFAEIEGKVVGGATVAVRTSTLELLEGREDLALLWDIRVAPEVRGRGVGRALVRAVETWAIDNGCRELRIETQNINVGACRFYRSMGYEVRGVDRNAYPHLPQEIQLLWGKDLSRVSSGASHALPFRPVAALQ